MSSRDSTSLAWSLIASTAATTPFSMPRLSAIGLAPAATLRIPLVDHRAGEHGRRRGAVTGDVVRLGGDLLGELGAHVLPRVLELDLLGDRDAVVRDGRARPTSCPGPRCGPSDRASATTVSASLLTPASSERRASSLNFRSLLAMRPPLRDGTGARRASRTSPRPNDSDSATWTWR